MSDARWMQDSVRAFHLATGNPAPESPDLEGVRLELRAKLIMEEALETVEAMGFEVEVISSAIGHHMRIVKVGKPRWADVIDGVCDSLYVNLGTMVEAGLPVGPFFHEVHRSNMLKQGGPERADGKTLKPPGWEPPRIAYLLGRILGKGD